MRKTFYGMALLLLLAACGQSTPSPTSSAPPTERIAPSPTLAPVVDTTPPPSATAPPMDTSTPPLTTTANADVTYVRAVQTADGSWTFHVTVSHPDTGWEDYADGWDILLPDGSKLTSTRVTRLHVYWRIRM